MNKTLSEKVVIVKSQNNYNYAGEWLCDCHNKPVAIYSGEEGTNSWMCGVTGYGCDAHKDVGVGTKEMIERAAKYSNEKQAELVEKVAREKEIEHFMRMFSNKELQTLNNIIRYKISKAISTHNKQLIERIKKSRFNYKGHFDSASVEMGYKMCKYDILELLVGYDLLELLGGTK
jgi:hypothetical protein